LGGRPRPATARPFSSGSTSAATPFNSGPAAGIIAVTLVAALHTRLQGILITGVGITMFIVAMVLIPRLKTGKALAQSP